MRAIPLSRPSSSFCAVHSILILSIILSLTLCAPVFAQQPAQDATPAAQPAPAAPHPLITQLVDESQLTTLHGNTHPLARPQFDLGTASASLPMKRMLLVLKRGPDQETALRKLLDDQQDKASPNYHKWLSPEQFGQQFGPTDSDMQTITAWLQSQGFEVGSTKGRTVLEFSGTAGQVQQAFHTSIHKYIVNGEQHWANATDPQIPTALTRAVAGVLTLHNFLKKSQIHLAKQPVAAKINPGSKRPDFTFSDGTNGIGPWDFATIYNSSPSLGSSINGQGVTIGVVGRSNLFNGVEDVAAFRYQVFQMGSGTFGVVLNGPDPGDLGGGEEAEATLDTTWAGATAPSANVDLVVSATTNTTDGIDLSELYIIENNLADVMTESFSSCEAGTTSTDAAGISALAEQAAAQGITYFVSSGDDGAEGCDDQDSETVASGPLSVNVLASTAFDVAVGGTVFNENGVNSKYWNSTNAGGESALSYIPEDVWNDSCPSTNCGANASIWAGSGGASILVPKPSWQSGVTGIPADNARDLPDVALTAASHDPYLLCLEGSCEPNSQGQYYIYFVWGTSASAPSFAGIMAMVDQHMSTTTGTLRQGAANYVLYRLASSEGGTLSQCNASSTSGLPGSACIFNDITVGNNSVPGELNYGLSTADYQAGIGYDLTTGLGSVNVANLVNQWSTVTFNPTMTTLSIPESLLTHGSSVNFTVTVSPSAGTGVPTGDVSLLAALNDEALFNNSIGMFTLNAAASIASSTSNLPGGTYLMEAHYAGDTTYAPSDSVWTSVSVSPEPSTTTLSVLSFDSQGHQFNFTNGPYGSFVYLRADVAGQSGHGTPTGTVNFADTFGPIPGGGSLNLNGGDRLNNGSNTATPNGVTFDTGTHTITASYAGDNSFNSSISTPPITFTITPGFSAAIPTSASQVSISAPGATGTSAVTISNSTGFSGTISMACSGLPSETTCTFSPATIAANGTPSTTTVSILVTTTAATATLNPQRQRYLPAQWIMGAGLLISVVLVSGKRQRGRGFFLLLMLMLLFVVPSCGGGSGSGGSKTPPPNPGTPAGNYNVTVTATSGSTTSQTGFTLSVQ